MKLQEAISLGQAAGLTDVEDCVLNIRIHAINLFDYDAISSELAELDSDFKNYQKENINA